MTHSSEDKWKHRNWKGKNVLDRRKIRNREPATLADVLPQVGRDLNLEAKARELALFAVWDVIVGERYAGKSRAVRLNRRGQETSLWVETTDASVASELSFLTTDLLQRLNQFFPQTGIMLQRIDFKISAR